MASMNDSIPVLVVPAAAAAAPAAGPVTVEQLLSILSAATEEQCCSLLQQLNRGMHLYNEAVSAEPKAAAAVKAVKAPKAPKAPKAEKAPLPEAADDSDAPDASSYRLSPEDIDGDLCQGRVFQGADQRWKPHVNRELQCSRKAQEGTDLCKVCAARQARYAENETPKAGWLGRITDDPFDWCYMLGTKWAEDRKPKWLGSSGAAASAAASDAGSDAGSVASAPAPSASASAAAKPAKEEKEAEKAAAKAAKEAEKAAAKAAKEAEKAAAKAAKEAEKAAAAAAKEAKKAAKPATAAKPAAAKPAAAAAKADADAEVDNSGGEIKFIANTLYKVKNGNVYEYNEMTETTGVFVGRLGPDDDSIDPDAEEE
jgi:hypothetical protein